MASSLSKNVLGMKFMQRTKERLEEKQEAERLFGKTAAEDTKDRAAVEVWKTAESHTACEGLLFGRMSFRGYNPETERLMAEKGVPTTPKAGACKRKWSEGEDPMEQEGPESGEDDE